MTDSWRSFVTPSRTAPGTGFGRPDGVGDSEVKLPLICSMNSVRLGISECKRVPAGKKKASRLWLTAASLFRERARPPTAQLRARLSGKSPSPLWQRERTVRGQRRCCGRSNCNSHSTTSSRQRSLGIPAWSVDRRSIFFMSTTIFSWARADTELSDSMAIMGASLDTWFAPGKAASLPVVTR